MEIGKLEALKIFEKNFNYEIVNTLLGKAVKMNWYDAFLYSNVTGAGYLDNPVMPFTPKGMMKIFYNAFNYNFVTGLFEKTSLKYSPINLNKVKPYLFSGDKYIIFEEFEKEVDLEDKLYSYMDILASNKVPSTDYIIHRIEKSKKGYGMESFMEYIACEFFKKKGFVVENQIPLAHTIGSPDFGGYIISNINDVLESHKLFSEGFHIIELSLLKLRNKNIKDNPERRGTIDSAIVGEAKTSTTVMEKQLLKYTNTNLFDKGIELHPSKKEPSNNMFSLLTFDEEYNIKYKDNELVLKETSEDYQRDDYYYWLEIYMKFYLLANLTNDELNKIYKETYNSEISSTEDIVKFIKNIDTNKLIDMCI